MLFIKYFGICFFWGALLMVQSLYSQEMPANQQFQEKYFSTVSNKLSTFNNDLEKHTQKFLNRLIRLEKKMQQKVAKKDSVIAKELFTYSIDSLNKFKQLLQAGSSISNGNLKGEYFPYLDTLQQSLGFLSKGKQLQETDNFLKSKLNASLNLTEQLKDRLMLTKKINEYLKDRKAVLMSRVKDFSGLTDNLKKLGKDVWYYQSRVHELKSTLSDRKKIEQLLLGALNKIPAFQQFVQQNAQLAGMFASPVTFPGLAGGNTPVVNGLTPRAAIQQSIQNAIPTSGSDANQLVQQQINGAASQIDALRNKINELGGMKDQDMPDFTPNAQRTRSFLKRLEFGTNLQFGGHTDLLPAYSDIGMQAGYKLNDKWSAGIGLGYRLGLGKGWKDIQLTSESIGFRTYLKSKLKKKFYVQGGAEWNYMTRFDSIDELKDVNAWQTRALLGVGKTYRVSKKLSGNVQLLYDFLHNRHKPVTQPLLFRIGYNF